MFIRRKFALILHLVVGILLSLLRKMFDSVVCRVYMLD